MPVGKNALKRVSNNGYSKVNTSAPDMEHSVISEPEKKPTAKPAAKAPTAKKPAPKPKAQSKPAAAENDGRPDGFVRVELGADMPVHLL